MNKHMQRRLQQQLKTEQHPLNQEALEILKTLHLVSHYPDKAHLVDGGSDSGGTESGASRPADTGSVAVGRESISPVRLGVTIDESGVVSTGGDVDRG